MIKIVLDTNFLVALYDSKDKWHKISRSISDELRIDVFDLVHLDFILSETISVLSRRLKERKRSSDFIKVFVGIRSKIPQNKITWASVNVRYWFDEILNLIEQHDGELNFNDAFAALHMQKNKLTYIISFDKDFDELHWITRIHQAGQIAALFG